MNTHTFIKEKQDWYIHLENDLKEFNQTDLTLIEGSSHLLDLISNGQQKISVSLDTHPFEKAVELKLIGFADDGGGGFYQMRNDKGILLKEKLWICDLPLFVFGDIPEWFYIRKVPLIEEMN